MKSKLAVALCLIGMLVLSRVGGAGNLDTMPTPLGDEDEFSSTDSGSWEPEAAAGFPARVERTGQTTTYGPRDDGKLRKGVAWPIPRFTDNGNGTVTDNLTGLLWLKNADCSVFYDGDATGHNERKWGGALRAANKLQQGFCDLTDGSVPGKWRLPNVKELQSLIHFGFDNPSIPNTAGTGQWIEGDPFSGLLLDNGYWSATTYARYAPSAWLVTLNGGVFIGQKSSPRYVWPVRGGQ